MATPHPALQAPSADLASGQVQVLLVGEAGSGRRSLAKGLIAARHVKPTVHTAEQLPLPPSHGAAAPPRYDVMVFVLNSTSRHSMNVVRTGLATLDVDYLAQGRVVLVETHVDEATRRAFPLEDVDQLAEQYAIPLVMDANLADEAEQADVGDRLSRWIELAAGLVPSVSALHVRALAAAAAAPPVIAAHD